MGRGILVPMKISADALLTEHEVAARLALRVATLRRWRWAGVGLPFIKIGSCVRYDPRDVDAFVETSRRQSTTDPGPKAGA